MSKEILNIKIKVGCEQIQTFLIFFQVPNLNCFKN